MKKVTVLAAMLLMSIFILNAGEGVVKASSFGFDAADATQCLQKAIDSGAAQVIVDQTGHEWLTGPIQLRSNLELILADGVVLRAKPGLFINQNDCLLLAMDCSNLTIRGEGNAVIKMNKKDYQDRTRYRPSEWRHTISLRGATDVKISGLSIENSGGDGIYIGTGTQLRGSKNIELTDLKLRGHHRQGMSVISVEKLLVKRCVFAETNGTAPNCGLDFEPNKADEFLIDCVFEDCEFSGNASYGILLALFCLNDKSQPISIDFKNCRISGNLGGVCAYAPENGDKAVKGAIRFTDCTIVNPKGTAIQLNHLQENGFKIEFADLTIDQRGNGTPAINLASRLMLDFGELLFNRVNIIAAKGQAPFAVGLGAAGLVKVNGDISLKETPESAPIPFNLPPLVKANAPNPAMKQFTVRPIDLKKLRPLQTGSAAKPQSTLQMRGPSRFLQYVAPGETVEVRFTPRQVRPDAPKIPVLLKDANQTEIARFTVTLPEYTYRLSSETGGVYSFEIQSGGDTVNVHSNAPGQGWAADSKLWLFRCNSQFYFTVPAQATEVKIEVNGEEPVSAAILDSTGAVRAEANRIQGTKILIVPIPPKEKSEIWSLKLHQVQEDHTFRLAAPLLPVVATSPENLLAEQL